MSKHKNKQNTVQGTVNTDVQTDAVSLPRERTHQKRSKGNFFLDSTSVGQLIGKCVLLLVIPYAYLILCGLIFDKWLKMYTMVPFIFYSLIALYVAAVVVIIWAVVRFVRRKK